MKLYPVHERFHSFQGEGCFMGQNAFFIRLFGCPLRCPWCDSAGTWHPDYVPKHIERFDALYLANEAARSGADFVVITGGEPAIHDLSDLYIALTREGLNTHIETSGSYQFLPEFDWVTVSPKWSKLPLVSVLESADEIKLIVEDENSIEKWLKELPILDELDIPIWLHPEWSQKNNQKVIESIVKRVKLGELDFRAGYQLHKLYTADKLDERSAPPAPLGGNPKLVL